MGTEILLGWVAGVECGGFYRESRIDQSLTFEMIPHRPNEPAGSSPAPAATNIYNYTLLSSAVDILSSCVRGAV